MATRTTKKKTETVDAVKPALIAPISDAELHARITARAHEIFLARNGADGDALGDWLSAEQEIGSSLLASAPVVEDVAPISATAPKRKRTTAKPEAAVADPPKKKSTRSSSPSTKLLQPSPSTPLRSHKRKTTDE